MPASAGPATQQMAATAPARPVRARRRRVDVKGEKDIARSVQRDGGSRRWAERATTSGGRFGPERYRHGTATRQPPFTFSSVVRHPAAMCREWETHAVRPAPRPPRVWSPSSSPPAPEPASGGPGTSSTQPSPTAGRWSTAPSARPSRPASGRWWWSPPDSWRRRCTRRWCTSSTSGGPPARSRHCGRGSPPPSRSAPRRSSSASATSRSSASTHGGRSPRWTPRSSSPPTAAGADTRCGCAGTRGTCCRTTATRARGRSSSVDPIS